MATQSSDSDSEEEWDETDDDDDDDDEEDDDDDDFDDEGDDDDESQSETDDDDEEVDDDSEESGSDYSNVESSDDEEEEESDDDLEKQEEFVDEGNIPAGVDQEQQEQDKSIQEEREGRKILFAQPGRNIWAIICCICFCLVVLTILGVVIWLVGEDNNETNPADEGPPPSPTLMPTTKQPAPILVDLSPSALPPTTPEPPPTRFPTMSPIPTAAPFIEPTSQPTATPSMSPTITPAPTKEVPDELQLEPFADTTIFKDGVSDLQFEAFGSDDTMLVQDGLASKNEIPDAYFLIAFDMLEVPTFDRLEVRNSTAILEISHVPADLTREPASLYLVRLPSTRLAIETLHSGIFVPSGGIEGPAFLVSPSDETVSIDISSLVFDTPIEDDQLFLMIENRGPEQEAGDRFKSRESDSPPKLMLSFERAVEPLPMSPPTISPAPTQTSKPSLRQTPEQTASPIQTGNPSSTPEIEI